MTNQPYTTICYNASLAHSCEWPAAGDHGAVGASCSHPARCGQAAGRSTATWQERQGSNAIGDWYQASISVRIHICRVSLGPTEQAHFRLPVPGGRISPHVNERVCNTFGKRIKNSNHHKSTYLTSNVVLYFLGGTAGDSGCSANGVPRRSARTSATFGGAGTMCLACWREGAPATES